METEGLAAVELTDDERRVLVAGLTEWGGASPSHSGDGWMFTTGMSDADTVDHLRRLQIKLMPTVSGVIGHAFGTLR